MLKTTYQYEQTAARLVVEGFPDLSAGQSNEAIGILSSWRLQLIGAPELEGTRDHLEALMAAVMPYARHRLSGVQRRFGLERRFCEHRAGSSQPSAGTAQQPRGRRAVAAQAR